MRLIASILFVVFAPLVTGCGRIHYLKPEKAFSEDDSDAIVVMRVVPNAYVEIQYGRVNGDGWFTYASTEPSQFWTEAGYLVARVRPTNPGEAYAVIKIRSEGDWRGYFANNGSHIPVFSAVAGRINYVGSIAIQPGSSDDSRDPDDMDDADDAGDSIALSACSCESDTSAVARFMAKHYPRVDAKVIANPLHVKQTIGHVHPWTWRSILPIRPIR